MLLPLQPEKSARHVIGSGSGGSGSGSSSGGANIPLPLSLEIGGLFFYPQLLLKQNKTLLRNM